MSRSSLKVRSPSNKSPLRSDAPAVLTGDLDEPLCALSLFLSVAERLAEAPEIDRDKLAQALQGAREQLADLTQRIAAACEAHG